MRYLAGAQKAVAAFHKGIGSPVGKTPEIRNARLRATLIAEEACETIAALGFTVLMDVYDGHDPDPAHLITSETHMGEANLVDVADGIADTIYVLLGTAVECGIDMEPIFTEVQRANMSKLGGPKRGDGKILKGPDYAPPDILSIVLAQGGQEAP